VIQRNGFSLIELIIAMSIGSIVSIMLYRIFQQSISVMMILSGMMEDYSNTLIFLNQLERDCASIALVDPACREKKTDRDKKSSQTADETNPPSPFSAVIEQGILKNFSLVTTHALPQIDHAGTWLVRVTYRLVEQPGSNNLFQLLREESPYHATTIAQGTFRAYPVLTDIVRLKVTFYVHEFREGAPALRTLGEWKKEAAKSDQIPAPEFIKFEGSCRAHAQEGEEPFSAIFILPAVKLFVERQRQALEQKTSSKQAPQKNEPFPEKQNNIVNNTESKSAAVTIQNPPITSRARETTLSPSGSKNAALTL
jgi:prepilin-type N-terminal cleavage/methylation domain-containing protein